MNSRERCLRAVKREAVDAIPLNVWIDNPEPLNQLLDHMNMTDEEKLLQHLEIDYRGFLPLLPTQGLGIGLKGGYKFETFRDEKGRMMYRDNFGVVTAMAIDGTTSMHVKHPLETIEVADYPWPEVNEEHFANVVAKRAQYENYCLIGYAMQAFETACSLFGYDTLFKLMFKEPGKVDYALDKLFDITGKQATLLAEGGVDQVYNGDDTGTETTMMISPSLWRRFLKPRYKKLSDIIHAGGSLFHFHSDGWIEPIIPDLIEVGVDVLEPIQPEAMNPVKIKREYGDRISFEGGVSIQRTLPFGTVDAITKEVQSLLMNLGPTGYTLRPSHTILRGTSVQNILALYEAAKKYRFIES